MPLLGAGRRIVGGWKRFIRQGLAGTPPERALRASTVQTVNVLADGRSFTAIGPRSQGFRAWGLLHGLPAATRLKPRACGHAQPAPGAGLLGIGPEGCRLPFRTAAPVFAFEPVSRKQS
jgi:hypothetical protein